MYLNSKCNMVAGGWVFMPLIRELKRQNPNSKGIDPGGAAGAGERAPSHMSTSKYVHGYSEREGQRLQDQAQTLAELLHHDSLFPAGFEQVEVSPRFVYVDSSRLAWVQGFTKDTYIAMIEGVREEALAAGLIDSASWEEGIAALKASAEPGGTFCYTFFKAVARK